MFLPFSGFTPFCLLLVLGWLSALLPACSSPEPVPVVAGTIRYQQDQQLLEATLRIVPSDSAATAPQPSLFGTAMSPAPLRGAGYYRTRRQLAWPETFRLTVPCPAGPACPLDYRFVAPFIDSVPPVLFLGQSVRFPVATTGLTASESLVLFLEPVDRSAPRRIQLLGPTDSGQLTLRKEVFADVPAGNYQLYLVKQQLQKDSTADLKASMQLEYFTRSIPVEVRE